MKRYLLTGVLLTTMTFAYAETFNVKVGNVTYSVPVEDAGEMYYTGGKTLTILGKELQLDQISGMTVEDTTVDENTIVVTYSGNTAYAKVDARIAKYVDIDITGAAVDIVQSSDLSADNGGELTYVLEGSSDNGSFSMSGTYKATVQLSGLTLTNPSGAPIDIQNGKRIKLKVTKGTTNKLTDGADGSQKGCLSCKGHLEIQNKGSLEVVGNTAHAIYAKEYITIKESDVTITKAVKDGLNCNQYFEMTSGTLSISGVGDDGIQVSFKDDTDRDEEDTGSITISGGTINVAATATAAKAIKADGDITISGGDITASVSGGGKWDSDNSKTKAASCFSADGNMTISGGSMNLTASGSGGKGISADGYLLVSDGSVTAATSGGMYAYVNGKDYTNYTGNTDNLKSDYKSSPKGIKVDGNITIDGGTLSITTKGTGGEGIESKSVMTINGGTINVNAYDDGLNSSSHMYLNGGDITSISADNDGIDSNCNMYIAGGTIRAFGTGGAECGIDANEEQNYSLIFTGGSLLAVGGSNSTPSKSTSTQPYVSGTGSMTAGTTVTIKNGSDVLASFVVPSDYNSSNSSTGGGFGGGFGPGGGGFGGGSSSSYIITCPGLTSGNSYTVTIGSTSSTVKAQTTGSSSSDRR